jgi:phage shock protein A
MVKIIEIVKKDLKEYYRESTTFKIVLFSPIIIIAIFGLIFGRGIPSSINLPMKIAICSMEENLPKGFIQNLKQETWVQVEEIEGSKDCDEAVKNSISEGKYKGGISIPSGFTYDIINGNRSYVHVYIDNSLIGVEGILRGYLWRVIQKYSEGFKEDPIAGAKNELFNVSLRLKSIKESISYSQSLENFTSNAEDLNKDVQNIDTKSYSNDINSTSAKLENAKNQIDSTNNEIESFRGNIQGYIKELQDIKADLINYDNKTVQTKNSLEKIYNSTCNYEGFPPAPESIEACDQLSSAIQELEQTHQDLQQKIQKTDSMIHDLEESDAKLKDRQNMLLQMKKDVEDSQSSLERVNNDFSYLDNMKTKTKNFSDQLDSYAGNIKKEEVKMKSELGTFSDDINELLMGISILPLNPIDIDIRNTFEGRSFLDFVIPSLITLLAMFTPIFLASTTIIAEKNSGTLTRNLLTPVSLSNFICGKITSIILIGLAELSVILLIGVIAFNISVPNLVPQLIACIVDILFHCNRHVHRNMV